MKQVLEYLNDQIEALEQISGIGGSIDDRSLVVALETKLSTYKEIARMINGSAPELHVCPDCVADVAYVKQSPGDFELVFVRHHS